jgi:hypothetical protein
MGSSKHRDLEMLQPEAELAGSDFDDEFEVDESDEMLESGTHASSHGGGSQYVVHRSVAVFAALALGFGLLVFGILSDKNLSTTPTSTPDNDESPSSAGTITTTAPTQSPSINTGDQGALSDCHNKWQTNGQWMWQTPGSAYMVGIGDTLGGFSKYNSTHMDKQSWNYTRLSWIPDAPECIGEFRPFSRTAMCDKLKGRSILFVGDSHSHLQANSLWLLMRPSANASEIPQKSKRGK